MRHEVRLDEPYFSLVKNGHLNFHYYAKTWGFNTGDEIVFKRYALKSGDLDVGKGCYLDHDDNKTTKTRAATVTVRVNSVSRNADWLRGDYLMVRFAVVR